MSFCPEGAFCVGRPKIFGVRAFVRSFVRPFVRPVTFCLFSKSELLAKSILDAQNPNCLQIHQNFSMFPNVQITEARVACWDSTLIIMLFCG